MSYRFEQTASGTDIVIDGWESGIADSPYASNLQTALGTIQQSGISDARNVNLISVPGEASVNFKSQSIAQTPISSAAFTVDTAGTFTYSGTAVKAGSIISLNTLTGGTSSLTGVTMTGNSALLTSQVVSTTIGPTRVISSPNGKAGTSALINIGFVSQPNSGDLLIFYLNGAQVLIQFVSVIGAQAGNVLIGANIAATTANLLGLLQAPATTSATQVALSVGNQTLIGYFTSTSGTVTVGLSTSAWYWVQDSPTATTFTLTGLGPYALGGSPPIYSTVVPATGSGTFSTAVNIGLLTQIVSNPTNTVYYGIDTNGRVWAYSLATAANWVWLGNTATAATTPDFNTGISVWNGYIFAFYDGPTGYKSYTCPATTTTPVWSAFKSLVYTTYSHRAFIDTSNTLYWCDGYNFSSLIQLAGTTFDPTNTATYVHTSSVFSTPSYDAFTCIEQLSSNLIIGTVKNYVAVWDRFSTGFTVVFIPENNIHRLVSVNSNTFIFAGNRARIYLTNGANAQLFKKIPDHLSNTIEPIFAWGGAVYNKNQLYFSLSAFGSGETSEVGISQYGGIWAIDTNTNALRLVNKLSYDTYGGFCAEMCGMIATATSTSGISVQNFGMVCGWEDSTETASPNYGSDVLPVNSTPTIANTPYTNYESYVDSDMIPIGTYLNPVTDSQVEYKLAVPMVAGEGVKLAYRTDLSQSFTTITDSISRPTGEFTSSDVGGGMSGFIKVNFQKAQWVQIRALLKSTATTPSYVRLKQIRLR